MLGQPSWSVQFTVHRRSDSSFFYTLQSFLHRYEQGMNATNPIWPTCLCPWQSIAFSGQHEWFESVKNTRNQIWIILRTYQPHCKQWSVIWKAFLAWGMQMRKHRDWAIKSLDSPLPPPAYGRKLDQNQAMSLLGRVWLLTSKTMESQAILRLDWEATSTFP